MAKRILHTTYRERKDNHMVIVMDAKDEKTAHYLAREIKKMVRRGNHLLNKNLSYELHLTF